MREELEQVLADKYWFMRRERYSFDENGNPHLEEGYRPINCTCGDGWFGILDDLCSELARECESDPVAEVLVIQVKEKYGTLRFDASLSGYAYGDSLDRMSDAICKAEEASEHVCERCGRPGTLRDDRYWMQTLCNRCHFGDEALRRRAAARMRERRKHVFGRRRRR